MCAESSQICYALNLLAAPLTRLRRLEQSPEQKTKNLFELLALTRAGSAAFSLPTFVAIGGFLTSPLLPSSPSLSHTVFCTLPPLFLEAPPTPQPRPSMLIARNFAPNFLSHNFTVAICHSSFRFPCFPLPPPVSVPSRFPPSAAADCGRASRSFRFVWGRPRLNMDGKDVFWKNKGTLHFKMRPRCVPPPLLPPSVGRPLVSLCALRLSVMTPMFLPVKNKAGISCFFEPCTVHVYLNISNLMGQSLSCVKSWGRRNVTLQS